MVPWSQDTLNSCMNKREQHCAGTPPEQIIIIIIIIYCRVAV